MKLQGYTFMVEQWMMIKKLIQRNDNSARE